MLHRHYSGVYSVGHAALAPYGRQRAALLAIGEGAILSHGTAAHLWGLRGTAPATIDVSVVGRQPRSKPGLQVHRVSAFHPRDLRRRDGLPLTSPARTLVDLAAAVAVDELERLVSEARVRNLIRPGDLETALSRAGHRPGVARMGALLEGEEEPDITHSKGERTLRRLLRDAQIAQPRANVRIGRWLVDFLWPDEKLVVEFDGFKFHGHRRAFERDRRKDVELAEAGYLVLRFTWRRLEDELLAVIASIARALGRRSRLVA